MTCYLIHSLRIKAGDAVDYVRSKRPRAVQTSTQIRCVFEFQQYLTNMGRVFCIRFVFLLHSTELIFEWFFFIGIVVTTRKVSKEICGQI